MIPYWGYSHIQPVWAILGAALLVALLVALVWQMWKIR